MANHWHKFDTTPDRPMPVEFFMGNAEFSIPTEPYRDERREIGFWDGRKWGVNGTGHDAFDCLVSEEWHPTHWRVLPAPPATTE